MIIQRGRKWREQFVGREIKFAISYERNVKENNLYLSKSYPINCNYT